MRSQGTYTIFWRQIPTSWTVSSSRFSFFLVCVRTFILLFDTSWERFVQVCKFEFRFSLRHFCCCCRSVIGCFYFNISISTAIEFANEEHTNTFWFGKVMSHVHGCAHCGCLWECVWVQWQWLTFFFAQTEFPCTRIPFAKYFIQKFVCVWWLERQHDAWGCRNLAKQNIQFIRCGQVGAANGGEAFAHKRIDIKVKYPIHRHSVSCVNDQNGKKRMGEQQKMNIKFGSKIDLYLLYSFRWPDIRIGCYCFGWCCRSSYILATQNLLRSEAIK